MLRLCTAKVHDIARLAVMVLSWLAAHLVSTTTHDILSSWGECNSALQLTAMLYQEAASARADVAYNPLSEPSPMMVYTTLHA
jgi:hypothetical protein